MFTFCYIIIVFAKIKDFYIITKLFPIKYPCARQQKKKTSENHLYTYTKRDNLTDIKGNHQSFFCKNLEV